jgi:hypothetical protein
MTEKHKASSLDTPTCHLADTSPILLTAPRHSQIEIAVPDDDLVPRNPGVTCQRRLNLQDLSPERSLLFATKWCLTRKMDQKQHLEPALAVRDQQGTGAPDA